MLNLEGRWKISLFFKWWRIPLRQLSECTVSETAISESHMVWVEPTMMINPAIQEPVVVGKSTCHWLWSCNTNNWLLKQLDEANHCCGGNGDLNSSTQAMTCSGNSSNDSVIYSSRSYRNPKPLPHSSNEYSLTLQLGANYESIPKTKDKPCPGFRLATIHPTSQERTASV